MPTPAVDFRGRIRVYVPLKAHDARSAHEQLLAMLDKAGVTLELTAHRPDAEQLQDGAWLVALHPRQVMRELTDKVSFPGFAGADELYAWLQRRNVKASIVTDTFSRARIDILRPLVRDVEEEFRIMFLRQGIVLDDVDKRARRRSGDHDVSMLYTHRLLNFYFLGPASDEYYLRRLSEATTDAQRLAVRGLTRLEELGYGKHAEALEEFSDVRNIVAHNRILPDEQFVRNYHNLSALKETIRTRQFMESVKLTAAQIQSFAQSMRSLQEQMVTLGQTLVKAYGPLAQMSQVISETVLPAIKPIVEAQIKDTQAIVKTLSRLTPPMTPLPKIDLPLPPIPPIPPTPPPSPRPKKPKGPKKDGSK